VPVLNALMAGSTHHQRFPLASRHPTLPVRWLVALFGGKIGKFADVVHFNVLLGAAEFADLRQEAFNHFAAPAPDELGWRVIEASPLIPLKRYPTEVRC
jgi:hypothetical protein